MNKDKRNNIQLLGTLNNTDESGIIANANQVYDANEDKSTQDVSKEHKERIETLETKESSMQTTLENITKTGEASAASNVTYNHNDSELDATNVQQAIDEVYSKGNTNRENDKTKLEKSISDNKAAVDASIQDVYKRSNYNDDDNIIDFNTIHIITKSSKYIYALIDSNENLILGILRSNYHIVYGNGIPDEVKDYIDNQINKILGTEDISSTIDSLKEIENFLKDFSNSDTLKALFDRQNSKIEDVLKRSNPNSEDGGIVNTKDIMSFVKSKKYYKVLTDSNDNIIEAILSNGSIKDYIPRIIQGNILYTSCNKKYVWALLDSNDNFIVGINRSNGKIEYGNGLPKEVEEKINEAIEYSTGSVNNLSDIIFKTFGIKDTNGKFLTMSTLLSVVDSKKYSEVKLDGNENIIEVRHKKTGIKESFLPVKIQGTEFSIVSSKKYISALLDSNDNFIIGINRKNANIEYGNGIPNEVQKAIESHTPNMEGYATEEYVDNKVEANGISDIEKQSIEDYNLPIPSYYKEYLAKRIAKINDTILNNEGYSDSFIFITDCHTSSNHMQSPKLIKYILANTTLNKVFYGGDTPIAYGTKDDIYNSALVFLKSFYKAVQPYGHLYCAVGNHDFTIRTSETDTTGYTFPRRFGKNVYMRKHRIGDGVVTNEDDSGAAYYYIDNKDEKVRYVVINTTDVSNAGNNAWGTSTSLSKVQMNWIGNIAIKMCPKDYKIVIIGHIPPMRATISNGIQIGHWSNFITAMKNKTSVTIGDVSYDFSDIADIVFTIWGHEHQDEQTFINDIPWIVSACDAWYNDYRHAMFGNEEDYPHKIRGTIYEQTFDIVNLDFNNNVASIIRIGGGYDRKIHLNIQEVKVGNTITLATDIKSPIWEAVDAIGNTQDNNTWKWTKKSTITSISKDKVSALSIGYSVICAYNPKSKEMELWGIHVK